jgi:hypothetical protein
MARSRMNERDIMFLAQYLRPKTIAAIVSDLGEAEDEHTLYDKGIIRSIRKLFRKELVTAVGARETNRLIDGAK